MGFTTVESRVEVALFKPSGKYYGTASVDMQGFYSGALLHDAFLAACVREFELGNRGQWGHTRSPREYLAEGWTILCLEPKHEHAHPILLRLKSDEVEADSTSSEPQREYRLTALLKLVQSQKARDEARSLFHQAWGNASSGNYDKDIWKKLQTIFGM